jgi:hypothetical protein
MLNSIETTERPFSEEGQKLTVTGTSSSSDAARRHFKMPAHQTQ